MGHRGLGQSRAAFFRTRPPPRKNSARDMSSPERDAPATDLSFTLNESPAVLGAPRPGTTLPQLAQQLHRTSILSSGKGGQSASSIDCYRLE
jgi:hypothetical protein